MSALRLQKLAIRAMPGFRMGEGFTIEDLNHDVIVLLGPNGSGKTTSARAIRYLLWPEIDASRTAYLDAEFVEGDRPRKVTLDAGRVLWQSDGARSEPPLVGDPDRAAHYHLALPELFGSGSSQDLTEALKRELAGGYNLKTAAGQKADFRRRPRNLENAFTQAKGLVSAAIRKEQHLRQTAVELDKLVAERKSLDEQLGNAHRLDQALRLREAQRRHREAWQLARKFDPALARLRSDDVTQAEALGKRRDQAETEWMAIGEQSGGVSPFGRPSLLRNPLTAIAETEIETILESWAAAEEEIARRGADLVETDRELAVLLESLEAELGGPASDTIARLRKTPHRALVEELREALELEGAIQALSAVREVLSSPGEVPNADRARRLMDLLIDWLRQPEEAAPPKVGSRAQLVLALVCAALGGLLLGLGQAAIGGAFLGMAAGLLTIPALVSRPTPESRRESIESEYEADLGEVEWTREAVLLRLNRHREELAAVAFSDRCHEHWEAKRPEFERLQVALQALADRRSELRLEPHAYASVARLLGSLDAINRATAKREGALAVQETAHAVALNRRSNATAWLARYGFSAPETASQARRYVQVLRNWGDLTRRSKEAHAKVQDAVESLDRLVERHGIRDISLLRSRVQELANYTRAQDAKRAAREALRMAMVDWGSETWPDGDEEHLRVALADLKDQRARREHLTERIERIRAAIHEARGSLELETAVTAREKARADLAEERDRQILASVAEAFALHVVEESQRSDLPLVFQRAQAIFAEVTQGRYRLDWLDDAFSAYDQVSGRSVALDGLSSGTRVQLLLSVRLAFVQLGEAVALPLLLDETLATSDPERSAEVIRAIGELISDGRQCFYFTTQPDEAKQWEFGLPGRVKVIRLDEVRKLATKPELWESAAPTLAADEVPAPLKDNDYDAYRERLRVAPKIDPSLGVGAVHLWHLFDRSEDLYAALHYHRPEWGRFESLIGSVVEPELADRVRARARAVELAIDAFRVGRPQQVITLETLRRAGMTEDFIKKVEANCGSLFERPNEFFRRLQDNHPKTKIPNVLNRARQALMEYLEANQLVDLRPARGPVAIEDRVVDLLGEELSSGVIRLGEVQRIVNSLPFERQSDQHALDF